MGTNFGMNQLGQQGSGFCDTAGDFTPPTGKVIVAITCLGDAGETTAFTKLVGDTSGYTATDGSTGTAYFGTVNVTANGDGSDTLAAANLVTSGTTIYGRWTAVAITADSDGGIICYFGD